jgi:hypothetical protein
VGAPKVAKRPTSPDQVRPEVEPDQPVVPAQAGGQVLP